MAKIQNIGGFLKNLKLSAILWAYRLMYGKKLKKMCLNIEVDNRKIILVIKFD